MDSESLSERLSQIVTSWSIVCKVRGGSREVDAAALAALLLRYGGAIQRYLRGALGDDDAATELSQEFALRLIRGDFHGVDPRRGRFRDYVKTVLFRMVANHRKERARAPHALLYEVADPVVAVEEADGDAAFVDVWRSELLDRAWQALAEMEKKQGQPYHAVLRLRAEDPDGELTSAEMAERLATQFGRAFTAAGVRKILQRARDKFAEVLIEDVAHSLESPTPEQLEHELRDLSLLAYCRHVLERRKASA